MAQRYLERYVDAPCANLARAKTPTAKRTPTLSSLRPVGDPTS
jgi:hypothetical protein